MLSTEFGKSTLDDRHPIKKFVSDITACFDLAEHPEDITSTEIELVKCHADIMLAKSFLSAQLSNSDVNTERGRKLIHSFLDYLSAEAPANAQDSIVRKGGDISETVANGFIVFCLEAAKNALIERDDGFLEVNDIVRRVVTAYPDLAIYQEPPLSNDETRVSTRQNIGFSNEALVLNS